MTRNLRTLTVSAVCERTGWPRTKVVRMFHAGKLAGIQEGDSGQIYLLEASLEELFDRALGRAARPADHRRKEPFDEVDAAILPDGPKRFA